MKTTICHLCSGTFHYLRRWGKERARSHLCPPAAHIKMIKMIICHQCSGTFHYLRRWGKERGRFSMVSSLSSSSSMKTIICHRCSGTFHYLRRWGKERARLYPVSSLSSSSLDEDDNLSPVLRNIPLPEEVGEGESEVVPGLVPVLKQLV